MRLEHWLYTIPLRLRSLFRRNRVEQELNEELQYHFSEKSKRTSLTARPGKKHAAPRATILAVLS